MMLRNRSRTVTKQPLMADQSSLANPPRNQTRPISWFFGSPRFFNGFLLAKSGLSDTDSAMSPTSILDNKQLSIFGNPFGFDKKLPRTAKILSQPEVPDPSGRVLDPGGIALALVEEKISENICKPNSRKVLFGSKLKIQIPSAVYPNGSPDSPGDFGTKTPNPQFSGNIPTGFRSTGPLSLSEMEMCEEYTCVISHGPNAKTTHIYDNCVVVGPPELKMEQSPKSPSLNFLSFCDKCKKDIGEGTDIYMYRGEKAFCSEECRNHEMVLDGLKKS